MTKMLVQGALLLMVLVGIGWAAFYGPHWIEYAYMQDVVKTGALTWGSFSLDKARVQVHDEIARHEIEDVVIEDCEFTEATGSKTVTCRWVVDITFPVIEQTRRLRFNLSESVDASGNLIK